MRQPVNCSRSEPIGPGEGLTRLSHYRANAPFSNSGSNARQGRTKNKIRARWVRTQLT